MIAPVAEDMNDADDPPVLQFMKTIADVGAGDSEGGGDLLRRPRPRREEKEGVDLGDGAIDPPARSHFAPMEDEFLRSEEHTSELQSLAYLVCRLLLEKKKKNQSST